MTYFASLIAALGVLTLPGGPTPDPLELSHFPDRLHAFVWRNWDLVPLDRMASVLDTDAASVEAVGMDMGLTSPSEISEDQILRSYITVIRRNWHILPYDQLLELLDWSEEELAFTLREDDYLYIKLGSLKPKCERLTYAPPSDEQKAHAARIAAIIRPIADASSTVAREPLFGFVDALSRPFKSSPAPTNASVFSQRYCYSYFALYGDPLLETAVDSYPDAYLARLSEVGVGGVWLQAVLYKLAPFPWDPALSDRWEERLSGLETLVKKAKAHGMGIHLYINEPRAMPLAFFETHPELKGAVEGEHAALCTSTPEVQQYIRDSVARICRAVPDLAGLFTITASENFTNCWSHGNGAACPRCSARKPAEVTAEVNALIQEGIDAAGAKTQLAAWDWGWNDAWAPDAIARLPQAVRLMSVSEWSMPITRGGVDGVVGEYSISTVGPGPRATRHWELARARGLEVNAKIQANNTWELSPVPYIPAVENVARHAANLRAAKVDGLMLGWTLGGYPSPNLEVVSEIGRNPGVTVDEALDAVARRRFGDAIAPHAVEAWKAWSRAFSEFPYDGGVVYNAPLQMGPANLLWEKPTGYAATMVGIPYDAIDQWRAQYPPEVFIGQLNKIADGFDAGIAALREATTTLTPSTAESDALTSELRVAGACAIHFRSVANQSRFVLARRGLESSTGDKAVIATELERILRDELALATQLYAIQRADSRIGFEATNHYFYVPMDLLEKVLNCRDLLDRWIPEQRARMANAPKQ